jgi:hypothetical protein
VSFPQDPRYVDAKAKPVSEVLALLKIHDLKPAPNRKDLCGPCPECGSSGHNPKSGPVDRFNIDEKTGLYFCRRCGLKGGDLIQLVRDVRGFDFGEALTFLCGERVKEETEDQRRDRIKRQQEAQASIEAQQAEDEKAKRRYRERAIRDAESIWSRSRPGHLGVVGPYIAARGIDPDMLPDIPVALRFLVDHPYVKKIDGEFVTLHRGPCMIAGILNPAGRLVAVHQTWIDPEPPHGKAKISYLGEDYKAKLVRGSKKGNAIRLYTPPGATALVMGEGIETTLSAMVSAPVENAAYWVGVDLGNMAGRMLRVKGQRYSGQPDMSDTEAFVPPPWVKEYYLIQDGDSAPDMTRAKLLSGARRAMAQNPGLRAKIVHPGEGVDLNDYF